ELALTLNQGDSPGLDEAAEALELAGDDLLPICGDRRDVDAVEAGLHTVLGGFLCDICDLCRVQQGLGRDATDVQAGATHLVLLDEGNARAELHRSQSGGVATASAAEYYKVKILFGHPATPCGSGFVSPPRM